MVEASPKRHCVLWGTRSPLDCQVPTAAPTQGAGPWSLSLGLPGRGAPRLLPLSIPLAFAPLPRRAFLTPPPFLLGDREVSHHHRHQRGHRGSGSLQPHDQLWGSLLLLQPQTLSAILERAYPLPPCPSLVHVSPQCCPGLLPWHPVPPCSRQTLHLPLAIISASGPGHSRTSPWQCLHEMATLCPGWFAPSSRLSLPSAGACWEGAAALERLSFASVWQGEAGLANGCDTLVPPGTLR